MINFSICFNFKYNALFLVNLDEKFKVKDKSVKQLKISDSEKSNTPTKHKSIIGTNSILQPTNVSKDKMEKSESPDEIDEEYEDDFDDFSNSEKPSDKILNQPLDDKFKDEIPKPFEKSPSQDISEEQQSPKNESKPFKYDFTMPSKIEQPKKKSAVVNVPKNDPYVDK